MPDLFTEYPTFWRAETEQPGTSSTVNVTLYRLEEDSCHTISGFYYPWNDEHEWYKVEERDFSSISKNPQEEISKGEMYKETSKEEWQNAIACVVPSIQLNGKAQ